MTQINPMICSPCTRANNIYLCGDTLVIGEVAEAGTYNVVIQDNTSGRITIVPVALAEAGEVSVGMEYFAKDHHYSVSIQQGGVNISFDVGEDEVSCVDFIVRTANGEVSNEQEITLK